MEIGIYTFAETMLDPSTGQPVGTGQRLEMTFMGPWDANPSKGWINYKAPLSQTLMGKKVGDEVAFEHDGASGTFKVTEIHNALV